MRRAVTALLTVPVALALAPAADAARTPAPALTAARCVPATAPGCGTVARVAIGKQVQLRGTRLRAGMRTTFRWPQGALATKLQRSRAGWVARVPAGTRAGTVAVTVRDAAGRRSNAVRVQVVAPAPRPVPVRPVAGVPDAFAGNGMWIWQVPKSEGGDLAAIGARARAAGIRTVFVKGADGTTPWGQFTPALAAGLKAEGLRVCSWQFVYGNDPLGEAQAALASIRNGADCFVIDAETRYEGRYAAAQRYVTALRAAVGPDYPLGLTSFPYVDVHPNLPYSVFLGPGMAQVNQPQVYWKDIGTSVDAASARTYAQNRIYPAALAPIGQTYQAPSAAELQRFRQVWGAYGVPGLSWWSWQASSEATWRTLGTAAPPAAAAALPDPGWPALAKGAKGDQVVWLLQHLASFDPAVQIDATLDAEAVAQLKAFQTARGLPATGTTDAATWQAVLVLPVTPVDWVARAQASGRSAQAASAGSSRGARRAEIAPPGKGR